MSEISPMSSNPLEGKDTTKRPLIQVSGSVTVERDLFEWLVEYALSLRGEWEWKRNSTRGNDEEMERLDGHIFKALQIRESKNASSEGRPPSYPTFPICDSGIEKTPIRE